MKAHSHYICCRLGYKIEKIPESKFHVSEADSHHVALSVVSSWNSAVCDLKSLCNGNDTSLFSKVNWVFCTFHLIISLFWKFALLNDAT